MEENTSLFSLSVDPVTKSHLYETAKWARFLAIVGFIFIGLFILLGILMMVNTNRYEDNSEYGRNITRTAGTGAALAYLIISVITFFPALFTLRFANSMKHALNTDDQAQLNTSLQNLKIYFRYLGIVTIIMLVLMGLGFFIGLMSRVA